MTLPTYHTPICPVIPKISPLIPAFLQLQHDMSWKEGIRYGGDLMEWKPKQDFSAAGLAGRSPWGLPPLEFGETDAQLFVHRIWPIHFNYCGAWSTRLCLGSNLPADHVGTDLQNGSGRGHFWWGP